MGKLVLKSKHRLCCGDSSDKNDVERLMRGATADLVFTSPPYLQQRDYGAAKEAVRDWDALMNGVFADLPSNDKTQVLVNLGLVHRDGEWLPYWNEWIEFMRGKGWRRFGWYVWDKLAGMPGDHNGRLAPSHEFIFHFNKTSRRPNKTKECKTAGEIHGPQGYRRKDGTVGEYEHAGKAVQDEKIPDSVVRLTSAHGATNHPASFPVGLPLEFIEAYANQDETVYDPFAGSGTTVIAAQTSGALCYAMELDPAYVDVAVERFKKIFNDETVVRLQGGE